VKALAVAVRGKGAGPTVRRASTIVRTYGIGARAMEARILRLTRILAAAGARTTLPTTASALERNPAMAARYRDEGIEVALHGYEHVDHAALDLGQQVDAFSRARALFERLDLACTGFRAPYLRTGPATMEALRRLGFDYDASHAVAFGAARPLATPSYAHGLVFYGADQDDATPVLPELEGGIVRIPYGLPDDESVVDRLGLDEGEIADVWTAMLGAAQARGELLPLSLHPERIERCEAALRAVVTRARTAGTVWIANLGEIAAWWRQRDALTVRVDSLDDRVHVALVDGPRARLLVRRRGDAIGGGGLGGDGWSVVEGAELELPAGSRPTVALSAGSSPDAAAYVRSEGFILETDRPEDAAIRLDLPAFGRGDRRALLERLQRSDASLVRVWRWPDGFRSALAVSGDVDAFTVRDYVLRAFGR
jgi:peptidoglycan/xylan/chitin deacetylase (PgdA/CDA1 family)